MPRMTLVASAPAPLMAAPMLLMATASDAAVETALMVALSVDITPMPPEVVVTPWLALTISASTSLSIWFCAMDRPMATATAVLPDTDAATDAATASAVMVEVSEALKLTLPAVMPAPAPLPSPSWSACTSVEIVFAV